MQYVVLGQGHWGKGPDEKTARKVWRQQGGSIPAGGYTVLRFSHDDALQSVDDWGNLSYQGPEPTVISEVEPA
jgi:hypothetical protein